MNFLQFLRDVVSVVQGKPNDNRIAKVSEKNYQNNLICLIIRN